MVRPPASMKSWGRSRNKPAWRAVCSRDRWAAEYTMSKQSVTLAGCSRDRWVAEYRVHHWLVVIALLL